MAGIPIELGQPTPLSPNTCLAQSTGHHCTNTNKKNILDQVTKSFGSEGTGSWERHRRTVRILEALIPGTCLVCD